MTSNIISSCSFWAFRIKSVNCFSLSTGTNIHPVECSGLVPRWKRMPERWWTFWTIGRRRLNLGDWVTRTRQHSASISYPLRSRVLQNQRPSMTRRPVMAEPFALLRINLRYIYNKDFGFNKNTQRFARYKNTFALVCFLVFSSANGASSKLQAKPSSKLQAKPSSKLQVQSAVLYSSLFVPILVVYPYQATSEGEYLTEGD